MKRIAILTLTFVLSAALAFAVFADDLYPDGELNEIKNAVEKDFDLWSIQLVDAANGEGREDIDYGELIKAYRVKEGQEDVFGSAASFADICDRENAVWILNNFRIGSQVLIENRGDGWSIWSSNNNPGIAAANNPDTDYTRNGIINNISATHPLYDSDSLTFVLDRGSNDDLMVFFTDGGVEYAAYYYHSAPLEDYGHAAGEIVSSAELLGYLADRTVPAAPDETTAASAQTGDTGGRGVDKGQIISIVMIAIPSVLLVVALIMIFRKKRSPR
ncbi:MAG: hypothetical protein IJT91_03410 [Clostridia bacterium]|nr:hypothetical protein [Clostridia bacterium]